MAKNFSDIAYVRNKCIAILKIIGVNHGEISRAFGLTPQKISSVRKEMPHELEEYLADKILVAFCVSDEKGYVTPSLEEHVENYTFEAYKNWINEVSDDVLRAEQARLYGMLKAGVDDERLLVNLTGIVSLIRRQLDIRQYTDRVTKDTLTLDSKKRNLDIQTKKLDEELQAQIKENNKIIDAENNKTENRIAELQAQLERTEAKTTKQKQELRESAKHEREELAKLQREREKTENQLKSLQEQTEKAKAEAKQSAKKATTSKTSSKAKNSDTKKRAKAGRPAKRRARKQVSSTQKSKVNPKETDEFIDELNEQKDNKDK